MARNKLRPDDMIYSYSLRQVFKFVQYEAKDRPGIIIVIDMYGNLTYIKIGNYRLASPKEIAEAVAKRISNTQRNFKNNDDITNFFANIKIPLTVKI